MSEAYSFSYNPEFLPRELARHYIVASDQEIDAMLQSIGLSELDDLFENIPEDLRFAEAPDLPDELEYDKLCERLIELSEKNSAYPSFIGDGLLDYQVHEIVPFVASLRNLTTTYTPYQPERSQGTLMSHWIYQCLLAKLTGFEAVNASLYDRASALFEAACCAVRVNRKADTVLVSESMFPGDLEVLHTLCEGNGINIVIVPIHARIGMTCVKALRAQLEELGPRVAAVAFPQINHLGILEDVNALTDLAAYFEVRSIAVIDPMLIATGGLKPPSEFGKSGCDIFVGEGQHLAIGANFGGPGLGIFGVRHNETEKSLLRAAPGRFVGKAKDSEGRDCLVQVLSTREQHIRKDKATSNICSNQAFLATLAGASILARGDEGMEHTCFAGHDLALTATTEILTQTNLELLFPGSAFYNEVTFRLPDKAADAIVAAREAEILLGVDVSARLPDNDGNLLKLSFTNKQTESSIEKLIEFFVNRYGTEEHEVDIIFTDIPSSLRRLDKVDLPEMPLDEIKQFYSKMAELNVSPDDAIFPLGSCTMKYNPYVNDWGANLPGFVDAHPQASGADVQGCYEVLFEIQEWFKTLTGLAGVTTQPVAGAQGELVGLKMFQAYHRDMHKDGEPERDVVLIPKSAHGTNFATAAMAGFVSKVVDGKKVGIVLLDADDTGRIKMEDLDAKLAEYGRRVSCIMITNPNTGGVFENAFKEIADKVHALGGLVYMDGANMNAIAGWLDLGAMGVDAVHNNLHKTWSIPHGGGGPGDGIVAVSECLLDYMPGMQIEKQDDGSFVAVKMPKCIGSFHRHWGNFAHKVRAYAYLLRLGKEGVRRMSAYAVLSSRYLLERLKTSFPTLPEGADDVPRMHEFILTLSETEFKKLEDHGVTRAQAIPSIGKLFLDFGYHAPTVAFPEPLGLMIEPSESYSKAELDRFADAVIAVKKIINESPELLQDAPYFTPIDRVDEVLANRNPRLNADFDELPVLPENRVDPKALLAIPIDEIVEKLRALKVPA